MRQKKVELDNYGSANTLPTYANSHRQPSRIRGKVESNIADRQHQRYGLDHGRA